MSFLTLLKRLSDEELTKELSESVADIAVYCGMKCYVSLFGFGTRIERFSNNI
jgi:hypothetical protein